jgi:hypothetical protein
MTDRRSRTAILWGGCIILVFLLAPSMAFAAGMDSFVQQFTGTWSCQFEAESGRVEYCGVNGSVMINTGATGYSDSLLHGATTFAGVQDADAYALARSLTLNDPAGTGQVHALTTVYAPGSTVSGSGTVVGSTIAIDFVGTSAAITESVDFGNPADPPGMWMNMAFDVERGWVRTSYDASAYYIQSLASAFGLSLTQATNLYQGGVLGLIGELSQYGYSGAQVVALALSGGIDHVRGILAGLLGPYIAGPIDQAAEKFRIPWGLSAALYREFGETVFSKALARSADYKTFIGNAKGWVIQVWAGSLIDRTVVVSGDAIRALFRLAHPETGEVYLNSTLAPYATIARVLPDGGLEHLAGYFSYIEFRLDEESGAYYAEIRTAPEETAQLEPGEYSGFILTRGVSGIDGGKLFEFRFLVT